MLVFFLFFSVRGADLWHGDWLVAVLAPGQGIAAPGGGVADGTELLAQPGGPCMASQKCTGGGTPSCIQKARESFDPPKN